jgi:hypothetical protein
MYWEEILTCGIISNLSSRVTLGEHNFRCTSTCLTIRYRGMSWTSKPRDYLYLKIECVAWVIRGRPVRGEALRAHRQAFSVGLKNVHCCWSYECTPNAVNVFDIGTTLPDRSDVSLTVATPCRLQLCAVLGSSASKKYGLYNTDGVSGWTTDISTFLFPFYFRFFRTFLSSFFPPSSLSLLLSASLSLIFPFLHVVSFFHC